jgi:hypothetical protein
MAEPSGSSQKTGFERGCRSNIRFMRRARLLECVRGWQRVEKEPQVGIYRRGDVWWIDYYDKNHERMQESSHSSIRREAEALLTLRKSDIFSGAYKRPVKTIFGQFGDRYMEHAKANKRSWLRDEQMLKHMKDFSDHKPNSQRSLPPRLRDSN